MIKKALLLLLIGLSQELSARKIDIAAIKAQTIKTDEQCYCAGECGPRARKINAADQATNRDTARHEGDRPFISTIHFDENGKGICFCQRWDEVNYVPNGCLNKKTVFDNSACK